MRFCMRPYVVDLLGIFHAYPVDTGWPSGALSRRFWPIVTFDSVLEIAARVEERTYRDFYESARAHPNLV